MVNDTVHFGNETYAYILLVIVLCSGFILLALFGRWFYKLFIPSKRRLQVRSRVFLLLLISWPLLISCGSFWASYKVGYSSFYSLVIEEDEKVIVCYLWPKGKVEIPVKDISSIKVTRKGINWKASDVLVIVTKTGKQYLSTSPVPESDVLVNKIREAINIKTPIEN